MKKIPEKFLNELNEIVNMSCEIDCEDCAFDEDKNNLCFKFSEILLQMNCKKELLNK